MNSLRLAGGRLIAYEEWGDPRGSPVLFFHGMPDSRLCRHPDSALTAKAGVRLITVDRPGYGGSTRLPARRLADLPGDAAALVDALGFNRFAVAAWSAGGPQALAVAYSLKERVHAVALAAPLGPVDSPDAASMVTAEIRNIWRIRRFPPLMKLATRREAKKARSDLSAYVDRTWFAHGPPVDQALGEVAALRAMAEEEVAEAFRQGGGGLLDDARMLFRPWDFEPDEVEQPVHLWHGDSDDIVFPPMTRALASRLPNCRLRLLPGEGHLALFRHWEAFFAEVA